MDCAVAALTLLAAMSIVVHANSDGASGPRGSLVMELD